MVGGILKFKFKFKLNFKDKNRIQNQNKENLKIPTHIGIIMDGNGRWAKKRGMARSFGHKAGAKVFRKITKYCNNIGVKYLTVYAFSTENWNRPEAEVNFLMTLFEQYLNECLRDFKDENIKVNFLGDKTKFSPKLQKLISEVEFSSRESTGMTLNIAMNYGGRAEITKALKEISKGVLSGEVSIDEIDEKMISENLYTKFQPDADLIIRPSGECRLSNFLTWQSVYSELIFMDVLWPDFNEKDLDRAILEYNKRNRRFGRV